MESELEWNIARPAHRFPLTVATVEGELVYSIPKLWSSFSIAIDACKPNLNHHLELLGPANLIHYFDCGILLHLARTPQDGSPRLLHLATKIK